MVATVGRIRRLTAEGLNAEFAAQAEAHLAYYANHPEEIERRLHELDEEWDVERAIELEVAGTVFTGVILGITVSKKWFLLSAFASAMLLLHNLHGQYPLLPLLRRLGLRTAHEIAEERYALKAMRGDFEGISQGHGIAQARAAFEAAHPTARLGPGSYTELLKQPRFNIIRSSVYAITESSTHPAPNGDTSAEEQQRQDQRSH